MEIHGFNESRMKKKLLSFDVSIADSRGDLDYPKLDETVRRAIKERVKKFPVRESHYKALLKRFT